MPEYSLAIWVRSHRESLSGRRGVRRVARELDAMSPVAASA